MFRRLVVCRQSNFQSIDKVSPVKNSKNLKSVNHDDIPIKSSRSNYANTSFEISLESEDIPLKKIPYIEPIASDSKTNLKKYVSRAFVKPKQCLPMIFDEQPPPYYDPQALFEVNQYTDQYHYDKVQNFDMNQGVSCYNKEYSFKASQLTERMSKSDFDLCEPNYSLSKAHISNATFTINSGSTFTIR